MVIRWLWKRMGHTWRLQLSSRTSCCLLRIPTSPTTINFHNIRNSELSQIDIYVNYLIYFQIAIQSLKHYANLCLFYLMGFVHRLSVNLLNTILSLNYGMTWWIVWINKSRLDNVPFYRQPWKMFVVKIRLFLFYLQSRMGEFIFIYV